MSDWTPGPWEVHPTWPGSVMCGPREGSTAHRRVLFSQPTTSGVMAEDEANTRLIAAAPEMAELLGQWTQDDTCPACGHMRKYDGCVAEWHDLIEPTVRLLERIKGEA